MLICECGICKGFAVAEGMFPAVQMEKMPRIYN